MKLKFGQPVHAATRQVDDDPNSDNAFAHIDVAIALCLAASNDNRITSLDTLMIPQAGGRDDNVVNRTGEVTYETE
jgi:hypothetical protein